MIHQSTSRKPAALEAAIDLEILARCSFPKFVADKWDIRSFSKSALDFCSMIVIYSEKIKKLDSTTYDAIVNNTNQEIVNWSEQVINNSHQFANRAEPVFVEG